MKKKKKRFFGAAPLTFNFSKFFQLC